METDSAEAVAVAWDCVVQAERASGEQLNELAVRLADLLVEEWLAGDFVMRRAAEDRLVHVLWRLADAAPIDRKGPIDRLAAAAQAARDELDELDVPDDYWEDDEDEDDDLPA